jgi:septal ring factor EnvC (AmiA/AmiB activator)
MQFRNKILALTIIISIIGFNSFMIAQKKSNKKTKSQLQYQQRKIERKINYTKKLLNETKSRKRSSLNQLSLLNKQVKERKNLINSYNNEIKLIDNQVIFNKENINNLQKSLEELKKEYAELIYQSYKSRSHYDQWMFLFASKDFYQAMRRMRYLKEYNAYRRQKAQQIVATQQNLKLEIGSLEKQKAERLGLLINKENEAKELEKDKRQKQKTLAELQQKEKDLKKKLKKQNDEWNKLNKEIQRLIEEEINRKDKNNKKLPMSPAEVQLSKDFIANVGKLPWPTQRGSITSHYGKYSHPQLHVIIDNKGVDFRCEQGAIIRSVFDGTVVKVLKLPQYKAVLIKHGDYYTVYNKMNDVFVKAGDKVTTKQKIGTVWTDKESGESVLHFELRKQMYPQNPEKWLIHR